MKKQTFIFFAIVLLFIGMIVSCRKEPVSGVILPGKLDIAVGQTATLTATVVPENAYNKNVSWETSNSDVVTVTNGLVTGIAKGKAIITVITQDGNRKALCAITVWQPIEPEMIFVEGGSFTMGCSDDECQGSDLPAHEVILNSFKIAKYPVTQEDWISVMGNNPCRIDMEKQPVNNVNWYDAQSFIKKLNALTGKNYRLPTEAEWEYAARGGNKSQGYKYSGSNNIDEVAWYDLNSGNRYHPVGEKMPNELGIYEMSGNMWEWCSDWYGPYEDHSQTNPIGPDDGTLKTIRGSCFMLPSYACRVACRGRTTPSFNGPGYISFRLVHP